VVGVVGDLTIFLLFFFSRDAESKFLVDNCFCFSLLKL
jgi:hypothetical protein